MIKLSFILPVYNVEPYVEKCIKSLTHNEMAYDEYEIIVINDGSPDNSEALIVKLQSQIPNIVLISQENAGVSAARNRGIEKANGEYVVFIDPDDYVNPNLLKRLYDRAKKDNLDILQSGRSLVNPSGKVIHMVGYEEQKDNIYSGVDAFYEKDKSFQFFDSSVGYLYRKDILFQNNIRFPIGVVHLEDGVFVRKIFTLANRVGFENCDFYQVFERPGSASRSNVGVSKEAALGDIKSAKDLLKFKIEHQFNSKQLGLMNTSIIKYALLPLMRAINAKNMKSLVNFNKLIHKEGLKPLKVEYVEKDIYLSLAKAYNVSLWLFIIKYMVKKKLQFFKSKNA